MDRARNAARRALSPDARRPTRRRSRISPRARRARATRCWSRARRSMPAAAGTPRRACREARSCPCWRRRRGGGRLGFPEAHPKFLGVLPPRSGRWRRRSRGTTSCWSSDPRCFPTTRTCRVRCSPEGTSLIAITSDPDEAARAPMGDAIVGDVGARAATRCSSWSASPIVACPSRARPGRAERDRSDQRLGGDGRARGGVARGRDRGDRDARRARSRCATGCGCPARVATTSARAEASGSGSRRRSACSSRSRRGRWCACSARARRSTGSPRCGRGRVRVPVTFLVLRNEEYMILKWFAGLEQVRARRGSTCRASTGRGGARLRDAGERRVGPRGADRGAAQAIAADDGPRLVQVPVASGMWKRVTRACPGDE